MLGPKGGLDIQRPDSMSSRPDQLAYRDLYVEFVDCQNASPPTPVNHALRLIF